MFIDKNLVEWGVKVLSDMISIATVNPPGENFDKFANLSASIFRGIGLDVEVLEVPKDVIESVCKECAKHPRYIVIGRAGSGKPVIQFNGHYDVVPPGSGWSMEPFKPVVSDDKVFGRGSVDTKGGIVASILAIKSFLSQFKEFRGTIEIALVPDEEIGGESGTGYLVKHISKPDYAIIAEPSGSKTIWIGHKGALWGFVEVFGRQAHGSTPWMGVNAFEYMARIATRFVDEYRKVLDSKRSMFEYEYPEGAKPTINIGGEVRGGVKVNVVPGYYAFSFDRRLIPEENLRDVENEIKQIVNEVAKSFPEVVIGISITNRLEPSITSPSSTIVRKLANAVKNVVGLDPKSVVCIGGLDLHYYTSQGIEAIAYGPGPGDVAHMANEYVLISEIRAVAEVYTEFLRSMLIPT